MRYLPVEVPCGLWGDSVAGDLGFGCFGVGFLEFLAMLIVLRSYE